MHYFSKERMIQNHPLLCFPSQGLSPSTQDLLGMPDEAWKNPRWRILTNEQKWNQGQAAALRPLPSHIHTQNKAPVCCSQVGEGPRPWLRAASFPRDKSCRGLGGPTNPSSKHASQIAPFTLQGPLQVYKA